MHAGGACTCRKLDPRTKGEWTHARTQVQAHNTLACTHTRFHPLLHARRWDTRTREGVVQDSSKASYTGGKDYARNTNFTCMATSGDGFVAVGAKVRAHAFGRVCGAALAAMPYWCSC